tara:strand:- start:458 stop:868 length:411 start_codon:yes stop_codon:yes gene_type:complete
LSTQGNKKRFTALVGVIFFAKTKTAKIKTWENNFCGCFLIHCPFTALGANPCGSSFYLKISKSRGQRAFFAALFWNPCEYRGNLLFSEQKGSKGSKFLVTYYRKQKTTHFGVFLPYTGKPKIHCPCCPYFFYFNFS